MEIRKKPFGKAPEPNVAELTIARAVAKYVASPSTAVARRQGRGKLVRVHASGSRGGFAPDADLQSACEGVRP